MEGLLALALIFVSSGLGGARPAKPTLDSLAWMAGAWAGSAGGVKGRTLVFEFLRIEQQGDAIVYLSMPNGRSPATPFPLKEVSGTRVVFENPTHNFPQRIIYWKDGADLRARIEGTIKGKAGSEEWRWSPGGLK